ncbi:hypothetical protein A2851_03955 [Candidatus Kaiserbacteria bacterium RIFCSPHIGHO2_01_FULL_53_29]|uniref:Diacylglycerol kinase n=1 Tax=Candidatus Kaiserbacteria bacterium RIFCSPHIGHO2_01_FULL_53_29 TaxID=1798480 RepID=A0A1F6CUD4_9BACT|nr:MAG: hypothetical protein A2851_03955 [Candidatus Kaiserbacteria bacterium RIFCSPHIGHO2_01_FULL_53_29]
MSFKKKLQNIRPSWRAVVMMWREELSFKLQILFGSLTIVASWVFQISKIEFLVVLLVIGAVLAIEALNTAIEELCDHVTPSEHPKIGKVKDLGSAASGLIGITATVIGLIIFVPHLLLIL